MKRHTPGCWGLLLGIVLVWQATVNAVHAAAPLFEDSETIVLAVEAPFHLVKRDRVGKSRYHDGLLRYADATGRPAALPVEVRARGKTRRKEDICAFPPLRLRFDMQASGDSPFAGYETLKLVTHCRDRISYDQLVLQEYLAYRLYNLLTDLSHRVRLARITYSLPGGLVLAERNGFVLEPWRKVAERNGVVAADIDGGVNVKMVRHADANRVALFQFLIGNEDYSMVWPESNDNCCHNSKPLFEDGWVIPLPYDFDFAGIVDAPYAVPKPPNRDVRHRRYGGLCETQQDLAVAIEAFQHQREAIYGLYREHPGIEDRRRTSTIAYLDGFYDVLDDPEKVQRQLLRRCKED